MNVPRLSSLPVVLFVCFLAALAGCSRAAPNPGASAPPDPPTAAADLAGSVPSADRSLIVTMDVAIAVERVDEAASRLRADVERVGGFVSDVHTTGSGKEQRARLELRVPATAIGGLRASLGELGAITRSMEKVEDVTEQRADLEARLRSARVQERRLLEIMSARAGSIQELVESERELARVRESIERLEAQERTMKSKIALATVRVELSVEAAAAWDTPGASLESAAREGVRVAKAVYVSVGIAVVTATPMLLPPALVVVALVALVQRRRARALAHGS